MPLTSLPTFWWGWNHREYSWLWKTENKTSTSHTTTTPHPASPAMSSSREVPQSKRIPGIWLSLFPSILPQNVHLTASLETIFENRTIMKLLAMRRAVTNSSALGNSTPMGSSTSPDSKLRAALLKHVEVLSVFYIKQCTSYLYKFYTKEYIVMFHLHFPSSLWLLLSHLTSETWSCIKTAQGFK